MRSSWEDGKAQFAKLTPELSDDQFQKLIAQVEDLSACVGDQSTLILDPDLDSPYLMDASLLKLPESASIVAGTVRLVGTRTSGGGLTGVDFNALLSQASLLRFNLDKLERGIGVAFANNPSGAMQPALDQPLAQVVSATRSLLALIEETGTPTGRAHFCDEQHQPAAALVLARNARLWQRASA